MVSWYAALSPYLSNWKACSSPYQCPSFKYDFLRNGEPVYFNTGPYGYNGNGRSSLSPPPPTPTASLMPAQGTRPGFIAPNNILLAGQRPASYPPSARPQPDRRFAQNHRIPIVQYRHQ